MSITGVPVPIRFSNIAAAIKAHNERVEHIWITKGSNCSPARSSITPSTVPAVGIDPSRVPAAEHRGAQMEVQT